MIGKYMSVVFSKVILAIKTATHWYLNGYQDYFSLDLEIANGLPIVRSYPIYRVAKSYLDKLIKYIL